MAALSDVTVNTGMYGYAEKSATGGVDGRTWIDFAHPMQAAGTLSHVQMRLISTVSNFATVARIGVVRSDGVTPGDYNVVGFLTNTAHLNAAAVVGGGGRWEYDTSATYGAEAGLDLSSIVVEKGDFIAFYTDTLSTIAAVLETNTGYDLKYSVDDVLDDADPVTINTTQANFSFLWDAYVVSGESTLFYDATGLTVDTDTEIFLPSLESEPYTIKLHDVLIANGEDFELDMIVNKGDTTGQISDNNLFMNLNGTPDVFAARDKDDAVWVVGAGVASSDITFATDDLYDIYISIDPTAAFSFAMKIHYTNYINGQGGQDYAENSGDIGFRSLSGNSWFSRSSSINKVIRSLVLSRTTAGVASTIGAVSVLRQAVVVVGDSYCSRYAGATGPTFLNHVGLELSDTGRWTVDRDVTNGGITGNPHLRDGWGAVTSIAHRYDDTDLNLGNLPNFLYAFVNGPGINDIIGANSAPTTTAEAIALGEALGWSVGSMATRALNNGSNVVLNECNYLEPGDIRDDEFKRQAVTTFNETLALVSSELQIPIAQTAVAVRDSDPTYYDDGLHLTTAGDEFMADAIVSAWENDTIAPASSGPNNVLYGNDNNVQYDSGNPQYG